MTCKETTELFYLAFAVWREARGETSDGQVAVAFSILDRVKNHRWWGSTVDQVVTQPWQYSSLTDPRDPQLAKSWPRVGDTSWQKVFAVCQQVMSGSSTNPVPDADSYHDTSIQPPKWAKHPKCVFVGQVGHLLFYNTKLT
jgi:spore germination cell wall hydrolase CwlJ-like protein